MRSRSILLATASLVLLMTVALTGCRTSGTGVQAPSSPSATVDASSSAGASGSAEATGGAVVGESLDASQAQDLSNELKAIEKELRGLDLPSDADFEGLEAE